MKRIAQILPLALAALSAAIACGTLLQAQEDPTLDASKRVFGYIGPGLRAIRRGPDGSYYVLGAPSPPPAAPAKPSTSSKAPAHPSPAVLVFDSQGKKLRQIRVQRRRGGVGCRGV